MKRYGSFILFIFVLLCINGCSLKQPTIAHTHIGHATTGWHDTPDKAGLFTIAEITSQEAVQYADSAVQPKKSLQEIKKDIERVANATDPQREDTSTIKIQQPYGLKQALVGSINHISFAASSDDASQNVRQFAEQFTLDAMGILERCDIITALSDDILSSSSLEEAEILAQEVQTLSQANLKGIDSNRNGEIDSSPDELGIKQLRAELQAMIDREDPPYTTINTWYLFNLIRLPSGKWIFKSSPNKGGGRY